MSFHIFLAIFEYFDYKHYDCTIASTTDGVTMNGALLVAGGSCLKSYITTVRTITDAVTDIITVIIRPQTKSRALHRMDLHHAHWAVGCDQRQTAARRWSPSSRHPSSKPRGNVRVSWLLHFFLNMSKHVCGHNSGTKASQKVIIAPLGSSQSPRSKSECPKLHRRNVLISPVGLSGGCPLEVLSGI